MSSLNVNTTFDIDDFFPAPDIVTPDEFSVDIPDINSIPGNLVIATCESDSTSKAPEDHVSSTDANKNLTSPVHYFFNTLSKDMDPSHPPIGTQPQDMDPVAPAYSANHSDPVTNQDKVPANPGQVTSQDTVPAKTNRAPILETPVSNFNKWTAKAKETKSKKRKIFDNLPKEAGQFPNKKSRLEIQKEREQHLNFINPQFVEFLQYSLKPEANIWQKTADREYENKTLNTKRHILPSNAIGKFELENGNLQLLPEFNFCRIKMRNVSTQTYTVHFNSLKIYLNVPYQYLTAFPNGYNSEWLGPNVKSTPPRNPQPCTSSSTYVKSKPPRNPQPCTSSSPAFPANLPTSSIELQTQQNNEDIMQKKIDNLQKALDRAQHNWNETESRYDLSIQNCVLADKQLQEKNLELVKLKRENESLKAQLNNVKTKPSFEAEYLQCYHEIIELKAALEKADSQQLKYQQLYRNANVKAEENRKIGQHLKNIQRISVDIDVKRAEAIKLIQNLDDEKYKELQTSLAELLDLATAIDTEIYFENSIFNVYKGTVKERLSTIWYPSGDGFGKDYNWENKYARLPWPINQKAKKQSQQK